MDVWIPVVTFILGQLFNIALVYASNRWQHRREREQREAAIQERWRHEAASILGAIGTLLVDTNPTRLGLSVEADPDASPKRLEDIEDRWRLQRDRLGVLSAGHPSAEVSELAHRLQAAVYNAIITSRRHALAVLKDSSNMRYFENATADYGEAERLRQTLLEKMRPT